MLTGEIQGQINRIWDAFWAGGIANPIEVIEQITYLLFIKRLDDLQALEEGKARVTKKPIERRVFPEGKDAKKRPYDDFRWSRFKNFAPADMYAVVGEHVFPFLRTLGGDDSTYAHHMKDVRLMRQPGSFRHPDPADGRPGSRSGSGCSRPGWAVASWTRRRPRAVRAGLWQETAARCGSRWPP